MSSVPGDHEAIVSIPSSEDRATRVASGFTRLRRRFTFTQGQEVPQLYQPGQSQDPEPPGWRAGGGGASAWASSDLNRLVRDDDFDLDTYGLTEYRDGFFDALFLRPRPVDREELERRAEASLPASLQRRNPLSPAAFFPKQWQGLRHVLRVTTTTRAGVKLAKTFAAVFVAYVLCLVPAVRRWLGPYNYIMVVSAVLNHPGRTVGAQIDGTVSTIAGTVTGLGWGAFGLWLSTSTDTAQSGYGAILGVFLALYICVVAAVRASFIRLYQAVICAGIAICYACLSDAFSDEVEWGKLLDYGVPWVLGQAICLVTCLVWFPDAGSRRLAVSLNDAFGTMLSGLDDGKLATSPNRQRLAQTFVNLSQAYRDLVLDFTFTRFDPADVKVLRNRLQAVIRGLLALRSKPAILGEVHDGDSAPPPPSMPDLAPQLPPSPRLSPLSSVASGVCRAPAPISSGQKQAAVRLVCHRLGDPTCLLLRRMREALQSCHAVLMSMSGYRKYLGPGDEVGSDLLMALLKLRKAMIRFDEAESSLVDGDALPTTFIYEAVEVLAYCRPIRQAATAVEIVLVKVNEMEQRRPTWRVYPPSYPWRKAFNRANPQVRHDRGGLTAGSYYRSFAEISQAIQAVKISEGSSIGEGPDLSGSDDSLPDGIAHVDTADADDEHGNLVPERRALRYRLWKVTARLQGFEMKFALKTVIATSALSIPAWLDVSRGWWNRYGCWWAVVMAWVTMHPRKGGGNAQDLVTRALLAALGAVWAGAAYAAGNGKGNPYVMAVFALIYLLPMLYRFTQSSHPRSGLVGCLSFVVTSLALVTDEGNTSPPLMAVSHGVAFVVGVVASITVNWVLWPFVARHELRKAVSTMMFFLSILYRNILSKYVYYEAGKKPTAKDVEISEVLEGRLREGFVRVRQLMGLTRHEIRLRAPFDLLPYSALSESCERFFEYLVAVRESALYFHPRFIADNDEAAGKLLVYRRDSVATVLGNLYTLAGALRTNRKVPKYLPSAAASRKLLIDKMIELEAEYEGGRRGNLPGLGARKKWIQIYSFSYNEGLTGCVAELEQLERYTKLIVGELGFYDPADTDSDKGD